MNQELSFETKKKILILGANGMLGHDLVAAFVDHAVTAWDFEDLDITNQQQVDEKLSLLQPDIVINAAAFTDVDGAQNNRDKAFAVNAQAVGYLAVACQKIGSILVHISTEYVFDGNDEKGYNEDANTHPANVYGESKAEGEKLLLQNCEMYYLVRTSWLYGKAPQKGKPRGMNFVETMLKLADERDEINVVNDQFGKPTYAHDLALAIKDLVEMGKPCGIYHLTNDGVCSWYDFAKTIFELKDKNVKLNAISSSEYPMPTPRPKYSILNNTKTKPLRSWQTALEEYLKK